MSNPSQFTCVSCKHDFDHEGASAYITRHSKHFENNHVLHNFSYDFECPRETCQQSLRLEWRTHNSDSGLYFFLTKGDPTTKEMIIDSVWSTVNFYSTCMMFGLGVVAIGTTIKFVKGVNGDIGQ